MSAADGGPESQLREARYTAMVEMHKLLLEAMRHREQDIVRFLGILITSIGGFLWLLTTKSTEEGPFVVGTLAVIFLLFLGATYSLALGYNYRYTMLQLAKLEAFLRIDMAILAGWPKSRKAFEKYRLMRWCDLPWLGSLAAFEPCRVMRWDVPWCLPPEIIKTFWSAFVLGILGVAITACVFRPNALMLLIVIPLSVVCAVVSLMAPVGFGRKFHNILAQEPEVWDADAEAHD